MVDHRSGVGLVAGVDDVTNGPRTTLLDVAERHLSVLFMASMAAHEFAKHGGDIERCNHHPCDLPEIKECVRLTRERAMASG